MIVWLHGGMLCDPKVSLSCNPYEEPEYQNLKHETTDGHPLAQSLEVEIRIIQMYSLHATPIALYEQAGYIPTDEDLGEPGWIDRRDLFRT